MYYISLRSRKLPETKNGSTLGFKYRIINIYFCVRILSHFKPKT